MDSVWLFYKLIGDSKYKCLVDDEKTKNVCSRIVAQRGVVWHMRRAHTSLFNDLIGIDGSSGQHHQVLKEELLLRYFNPDRSGGGFTCRRCKANVLAQSTASGLWHHLRFKHYDVYVCLKAKIKLKPKIKLKRVNLKLKKKSGMRKKRAPKITLLPFFRKVSDTFNLCECVLLNAVTKEECRARLNINSRRRHLQLCHADKFRELNVKRELLVDVSESKPLIKAEPASGPSSSVFSTVSGPPSGAFLAVSGPPSCVFCKHSEDNKELYGELQHHNGIALHYFCSLFASNLKQYGDCDRDPLWGFRVADIKRELKRAYKMRCLYCHNTGATIGCCFPKCRTAFHYPCGVVNDTVNQFYDTFKSFCAKHRIQQKMPAVCRASECRSCFICLDDVEIEGLSPSVMLLPCCSGARLHRTCIQRMAISAGKHHFKCPLCNNVEVFLEKMMYLGIYVPDQDAAWELERNAYHDLLARHKECDVQLCICPDGRNYCNTSSPWDIILCRYCGSQGTHLSCSRLTASQTWACSTCLFTLKQTSTSRRGRGALSGRGAKAYHGSRGAAVQRRPGRPPSHSVRPLRSRETVNDEAGGSSYNRSPSKSRVDAVGFRRGRSAKFVVKKWQSSENEDSSDEDSRPLAQHSALRFFHSNTTAVNFSAPHSSSSAHRSRSNSSEGSCKTILDVKYSGSEKSDEDSRTAPRDKPPLKTRGRPSRRFRGACNSVAASVSSRKCVVASPGMSKLIESDEEKLSKMPFVRLPRLPRNLLEVQQRQHDSEGDADVTLSYESDSSCGSECEHLVAVDVSSSPDSSPVAKTRSARWIPGSDGRDPVISSPTSKARVARWISGIDGEEIAVAECSKRSQDSSSPSCARHRPYKKSEKSSKKSTADGSTKRSPRLAVSGQLEPVRPAPVSVSSFPGSSRLESMKVPAGEVYEISDSESSSSVRSVINLASQDDDDDDDVVWVAENSQSRQPQLRAPAGVSVIDLTSSSDRHARRGNQQSSRPAILFSPSQNNYSVHGGSGVLGGSSYQYGSVDGGSGVLGASSFPYGQNQSVIPNDISYWLAMASAAVPTMAYLNRHHDANSRR